MLYSAKILEPSTHFAFTSIKSLSIQVFLFGEKYLHVRKLSAEEATQQSEHTPTMSIEETFLSNKPKHTLAKENVVLQKEITESQKMVDILKSHIAAISSSNGFITEDEIFQDVKSRTSRTSCDKSSSCPTCDERKSMEMVRNPLIYSSLQWEKM